jgi:hypothetical protein
MSITTNKRIAIFYHCAEMNNWKEIDAEIMEVLKTSGLLDRADIFVKNNCKDIGLYEFPTLELLDQFCVYHQDYYVLYIMNKGVSRPTSNQSSDWRKCMLYWNVERWKECVAKLDEGFEAVGINVVDTPHRHFQGNFWWTTAKHIASLGNINDIEVKEDKELDIGERHKAEFWVLSKPTIVYSPYHHHINPYIEINPRDNYINKKF